MTTAPSARALSFLSALLLVIGLVAAAGVSHGRATATDRAHGASSAPPWPAPAGSSADATLEIRQDRATLARLDDVWGQKLAEHLHAHLSITIDGRGVTVPGQIGLAEKQRFATSLHTHDTSGIVHIESPTRADFTLGQFFTEWDVRLDARHIGAEGSDVGEVLTVFVDGRRRAGDPASLVLENLQQIDLVIAPAGVPVHPAPSFDWPPQYR